MISQAPFGRTGHNSSRLLFGAAALAHVTQSEADTTLDLVLDSGINHLDTAASYGQAEERMGPWLKVHRPEVFLATKTEKRTKKRRWRSSSAPCACCAPTMSTSGRCMCS
ncbi:MAG: hypothetical protein SAMD01599839_16100 [Rectinema sp.]